jgi:hypothetical protein
MAQAHQPGAPDLPEAVIPAAARTRDEPLTPANTTYTGVVLIHGIGDERRNNTLNEALNALMYWFNHAAGLTNRPEGSGRVWMRSHLTFDDDPDAAVSRATLELVAPSGEIAGETDHDAAAQIDFREVWWADTFGLPNIGQVIAWARVQFREQAAHILLPFGRHVGPSRLAHHAPALQTPQALTYRPATNPTPPGSRATRSWRRAGLTAALGVYDLVQYGWKLAQWLVLTPLILAALYVLSVLRLLTFIPFIRSALLSAINGAMNYLMLHWVASMRVYLLDYTRSSAMRDLFVHEVETLLRDPACERIVVLAYSMGTVISYEGLTTLYARPEWRESQKPITYICLAAALRRMWLLQRTDPQRLRGVLPTRVRWLHFWARYDPVAVGPVSPQALPRLDRGVDPLQVDRYAELCASLERCENIDVVNTDSSFQDHTTYWQNLDQVVGPIALELVAGHPALEALVRERLASPDEILRRRWAIAWRALVAIAGGLTLAGALVSLDIRNHGGVGSAILTYAGDLLGSAPVQSFLNENVPGYALLSTYFVSGAEQQNLSDALNSPYLVFTWLLSKLLTPGVLATFITAILATGIGVILSGKLVEPPNPFAFRAATPRARGRQTIFVLSMSSLLLLTLGYVIFFVADAILRVPVTGGAGNLFSLPWPYLSFLILVSLSQALGVIALLLAGLDVVRTRQWGWLIALIIVWLAPVNGGVSEFASGQVNDFDLAFYLEALFIGCLVATLLAARQRSSNWFVVLAMTTLLLGSAIVIASVSGDYFFLNIGAPFLLPPLVALLYGLWVGPYRVLQPERAALRPSFSMLLILGTLVVVLLSWLGVSVTVWPRVALASALICLTVIEVVRKRQWGWLATLLIIPLCVIGIFIGGSTVRFEGGFGAAVSIFARVPTFGLSIVSLSLLIAAASYALWAGDTVPGDDPGRVRSVE